MRLLGYKQGSPHAPPRSGQDAPWSSGGAPPEWVYRGDGEGASASRHTFVSEPGTGDRVEDVVIVTTSRGDEPQLMYGVGRAVVHDNCWGLLCLALSHVNPSCGQDFAICYLLGFVDDFGGSRLSGGPEVDDAAQQSWLMKRDDEDAWVMADVTLRDPVLDLYLRKLCEEDDAEPPPPSHGGILVHPTATATARADNRSPCPVLLDRLPAELLDMVMQELPDAAAKNLRLAYRPAAAAMLSPAFWRSRFIVELPMLIEMPWLEGEYGVARGAKVPWERLYQKLVVEHRINPETAGVSWRNRVRAWRLAHAFASHLRLLGPPTW